jgi:hypothetical protein
MIKFKIIEFIAQNKCISKVHKENSTKIENIEKYKIFTRC